MRKLLAVPVLGLIVLAAATAPAAAKRGVLFRAAPQAYDYATPYADQQPGPFSRGSDWESLRAFENSLDFETRAVHYNLRTNWYH